MVESARNTTPKGNNSARCFTSFELLTAQLLGFYLGDTTSAALLIGAGLVSIVGAFLYSNKK